MRGIKQVVIYSVIWKMIHFKAAPSLGFTSHQTGTDYFPRRARPSRINIKMSLITLNNL